MLSQVPLNASHLSLYIEGEQAVVFNHACQTLFKLTPVSISLLLALDEEYDERLAIAKVVELSELDTAQVAEFLPDVTSLFSLKGSDISFHDGLYPELKLDCQKSKYSAEKYVVGHTYFGIDTCHKKLARDIAHLLKPCRVDTPSIHIKMVIVEHNNWFDIVSNGHLVQSGLAYEQVMPELIDRIQILAFQRSQTHLCFHGAALRMAHGDLLMPGESGAGKSTLTAYLSSNGAQLYSDEMIALDNQFKAMVINLPIAIKSGSWSILKEEYSELNRLSAWRRLDGRQLKYVWPSSFVPTNQGDMKAMLICPQYQEKTVAKHVVETTPLSVIDTLTWLVQSGYQVTRQLDQMHLAGFINYLNNLERYVIRYHCNEQASHIIERLWQRNG